MTTQTELLREALERMDRARNILTKGKPTPDCNWGMLDTTSLRAALAQPPAPEQGDTHHWPQQGDTTWPAAPEAAKPETERADIDEQQIREAGRVVASQNGHEYPGESEDAYLAGFKACAALLAADSKAGGELDQSPVWNAQSEAIYWLNEIEKCQGGANGPTIKLRAAILWVFEPPYANTHPPAAQKLLPDEQVALLFRKGVGEWMTPGTAFVAGFRSAERAYGIG